MQLLLVVCFCNFFVLFLFIVQIKLSVIFDSHEKMWEYVMIRVGGLHQSVEHVVIFFFRSHKPELVYNQWYYSLSLSHSLTCIIFQGHSNVKQLKFYVIWFISDFDCQLHHLSRSHIFKGDNWLSQFDKIFNIGAFIYIVKQSFSNITSL